jgi:hypothetical protein
VKNKISIISLIACYLVMCYAAFIFYPKWNKSKTEATLSWDANGYYAFLPAIFIYKDLKHVAYRDSIMQKYVPSLGTYAEGNVDTITNKFLMRYSCGQAIIMSPWFFIAHTIAWNSAIYPTDGYSFPYQFCIGFGMFLLALIGLGFFRKILLQYYSDKTTAITLIAIVFGTNYLNYSSIDQAMTHSTLFSLYCLLIYNVINYYKKFQLKNILAIGIISGLIILVRPPDIICLVIPILWGVSNIKDAKNRLLFLFRKWSMLLLVGVIIVTVLSLQLAYGYYISGNILYNGYKGFEFDFLHPHCIDYCFNPRAGWLLYCPMILLSVFGVYQFVKTKQNVCAVLLLCLLSFYLVSAWQVWWYGGRAMVQYYVLFAFLLAALVEYLQGRRTLRIIFYSIGLLFIYINLWWTYFAHKGSIRVSETSYAYYFHTIGRWNPPSATLKLIDNEDANIEKGKNEKLLFNTDLKTDSANYFSLEPTHAFSEEIKLPVLNTNAKSIFIHAQINCNGIEKEDWQMPQMYLEFYSGDSVVKHNMYRIGRETEPNKLDTILLKALFPKQKIDSAKIYFWNAGSRYRTEIYNVKCFTYN